MQSWGASSIEGIRTYCRPCRGDLDASVDAAVLMPLVLRNDELRLLFVRKGVQPGYPWSGHVAFPGGRVDGSDGSTADTALRELWEETGIPRARCRLLGSLGRFRARAVSVTVEAFVGLWDGSSDLCLARSEIQWAREMPIGSLLAHHRRSAFRGHSSRGLGLDLRYPVGEVMAWGLSARMLHALLEGLEGQSVRPGCRSSEWPASRVSG